MLVLKKNVEFNCVISMRTMTKFILYTGVPNFLPNMRPLAMACTTLLGDTPPPCVLCTALVWPCVLRTAIFCLAYCVPFNNKNNNFRCFHLHKDNKMTVCCMHM